MSRRFRCEKCGYVKHTKTKTGKLPRVCAECNPEAARRRAKDRARDAKLVLTEELLWHFSHALINDPGKPAIVECIKALHRAEGKEKTRVALLRLAGACLAWALELSPGTEVELVRLDALTSREISNLEDDGRQAVGQ